VPELTRSPQSDLGTLAASDPQGAKYRRRLPRRSNAAETSDVKDKLGIKGLIQEGAQEDRSYYYSLPRLEARSPDHLHRILPRYRLLDQVLGVVLKAKR
jgi:hypothetical protein